MRVKFVIVSLSLLYLIGWSFGVSLNHLSNGDIVESGGKMYEVVDAVDGGGGGLSVDELEFGGLSKDDVVETSRGIIEIVDDIADVQDLAQMPPPPMEMGCSCTCDPIMDAVCILCEFCDPNMVIWQENEASSNFEHIVRTLPHIPVEYVDWLMYMNPRAVNFVIHHHHDAASLITHAQAGTLAHIISSVADFPEILARMHPNDIVTVFQRIPYPCEYLRGIRREAAETIIGKIGYFSHCLPKTTTTTTTAITTTTTSTTTTTTPTTTPEPGNATTPSKVPETAASKASVDVDSLFTKEELDYMTAKVPRMKALLAKAVPEAVRIARIIHSDLKQLVDDLSDDFLNFLNTPGLAQLETANIHSVLKDMAKDDLAINAIADLFA
nr:hypothetical transcript [Hymenolepis microstoma]